jgi:hypothetical protein
LNHTATFNFHDRIGVQVQSPDLTALSFFKAEYGFHQGDFSPSLPKVSFMWGKILTPGISSSYSHKLLARWKYKLNWRENEFSIESSGNWFALPMAHHMMLHPAIRLLSSQSGTLLLHGAAVVKDGRSLILTGPGGTGKTMSSSLILSRGGNDWQLHSDDYVFIDKGVQSLAYLTRSHLYRDQFRWTPEIAGRLSLFERLQLELFGRIRAITTGAIKWPVRLSMTRLWPGYSSAYTAQTSALLLLERSGRQPPHLEPAKGDSWVEKLLDMNFGEARYFIQICSAMLEAQGHSGWLEKWREQERELIKELLCKTPVLRLVLPKERTPQNSFIDALISCAEEALKA